jgi:hypothetical protein
MKQGPDGIVRSRITAASLTDKPAPAAQNRVDSRAWKSGHMVKIRYPSKNESAGQDRLESGRN